MSRSKSPLLSMRLISRDSWQYVVPMTGERSASR